MDLIKAPQDGDKNRSLKTDERPAAGAFDVELASRAVRNTAIRDRT